MVEGQHRSYVTDLFARRGLADKRRHQQLGHIFKRNNNAAPNGEVHAFMFHFEMRVNKQTPLLTTLEDLQFTSSLVDAYPREAKRSSAAKSKSLWRWSAVPTGDRQLSIHIKI
jgi:hypothetical protein